MLQKIIQIISNWWEQSSCPHGKLVYVGPAGAGRELANYWHLEKCEDCGIFLQVMNNTCRCSGEPE